MTRSKNVFARLRQGHARAKVEWMRSNPLVCFEVDEVQNQNRWSSVIVFGRYEECPRVGERMAELLKAPLMLLVIILAANWIVRRFQLPNRLICRLGAGLIAFILGLVFEFGLVLTLRGLTLREYLSRATQLPQAFITQRWCYLL